MEQVQGNKNAREAVIYDIRRFALIAILILLVGGELYAQPSVASLKKSLAATSKKDVKRRMNLLNDITWEYTYLDSDSAFYYGQKAIKLARKYANKYPNVSSNSFGTVAILYDIQGDNEKALSLYFESLKLKEAINDSAGISVAKSNIGALFYTQEDYDKALPYFKESFEIDKSRKDTLGQIGSLINIAVIHKNQGKQEQARKDLLQALHLSKKGRRDEYKGSIFNNLGAQYLATNELDSALFYFQKGEQEHLKNENFYDYGIALDNMASIYLKQGDSFKAKQQARAALRIAEKEAFFLLKTNAYETLYEIFLVEGDLDSAFYNKQQYESLNDSILQKENKQIVDEIEAKYELQKKQNQILEKDIEIAAERKASLMYQAVSISILVISLILAVLIWSKIRNNRKLEQKNEVIEKSLAEKEVLMREIHHRVKNNIQAIKSIVNIQKRKTTSEETKDSLNETLNRVNAMAVIHDRLYKQKNITELSSEQYLKELLTDILGSFGLHYEDEKIQVQLCSYVLEVDELLTLGLVFNELITNSCKYGRGDDDSLDLRVESSVDNKLFRLVIADKGPGRGVTSKGFGSDLIDALIHKLNGKIHYISEQGFKAVIEISIHEQKT